MSSPVNSPHTLSLPQAPKGGRHNGIYLGTLSSTSDPQSRGRVQVSIPSLGIGPLWAPVCTYAGTGRVAGRAIVGFLDGDAHYPIVLGFIP